MKARTTIVGVLLAASLVAAPGTLLAGGPQGGGGGSMTRAASGGDMVQARDRLQSQARRQSAVAETSQAREQDRT